MAETHDTIKSLLAEFRGYAAGMPASYHVTMSWHDFRKMLDRLEAAHDHDVDTATDASARAVVGACVKLQEAERKCVALREAVTGSNQLREALVKARRFIASSPLVYIEDDAGTIVRGELCAEIDAALSAPPRNCDLYKTKEEAQEAFLGEACDHPCGNCWIEDINNECGVDWLLAPATGTEGGAK